MVCLVGVVLGCTPIDHNNGSGIQHDCGSGWAPDDYYQCPTEQAAARQKSLIFLLPGAGMVIAGFALSRTRR
ncbi:hypothetical protein [Actinomadura xylanilytica]|uniref:hypothetical protein n=1 Tax=Actinomadura xylanilytica TaxID=887459 RepID=UPI00255AE439|nr:hypothetical protein [Actinomadura xylanilytica]MDL4773184.1 hypothetical protein [Actinomadura xylanilytica]